jgi:hypothetical protein
LFPTIKALIGCSDINAITHYHSGFKLEGQKCAYKFLTGAPTWPTLHSISRCTLLAAIMLSGSLYVIFSRLF